MARRPFLVAALLAALLSSACETKRQQPGAAVIEGGWIYDNNCAECHENPQPDLHKQPPNLHGLFLRKSLPSGALATDSQVRMTIIQGKGTMPAFDQRLREEDLKNLLAYLRTLR
jgi:mono/diheme cytochrome c family protein